MDDFNREFFAYFGRRSARAAVMAILSIPLWVLSDAFKSQKIAFVLLAMGLIFILSLVTDLIIDGCKYMYRR
jgi:hypothetical protein